MNITTRSRRPTIRMLKAVKLDAPASELPAFGPILLDYDY